MVLTAGIACRRLLKTRISKAFCLVVATIFATGHGMNILVIRANGGKMPVLEGERNWENAPSINLPDAIDGPVFDSYLPTMQKMVLLTDEPHRIIPEDDVDEVHLKFLADQYPIKITGRHSLYSLGDVFIALGLIILLVGIIPVWLIARRSQRAQTS